VFSVIALHLVERSLNVALTTDPITQQQLYNRLDGRCLRIVSQSPQMSIDISFDGYLEQYQQRCKIRLEPTPLGMSDQANMSAHIFEQRPYDTQYAAHTADCTLSVTHLVELGQFASDEFAGSMPVSGDLRILQQLKYILAQTDINLTSLLQPLLGASVTGQLQSAWAALTTHGQHRASQARFYADEWLKTNNALLATRWQMQQLKTDMRSLRTDIEREHTKLDQLIQQAQLSSSSDSLS